MAEIIKLETISASASASASALASNPSPDEPQGAALGLARRLLAQPTISAKIRFLNSEGFTNPEIVRILAALLGRPIRPQHVNNVLTRPLKGGKQGRYPTPSSPLAAQLQAEVVRLTTKSESEPDANTEEEEED
jgi:hypothetical protein